MSQSQQMARLFPQPSAIDGRSRSDPAAQSPDPGRATSSSSTTVIGSLEPNIRDRIKAFHQTEVERLDLMLELVRQNEMLRAELNSTRDTLKSEQEFRDRMQDEVCALEKRIESWPVDNYPAETTPFMCVVIDGDNAMFRSDLLSKGAAGGAETAQKLLAGSRSYLRAWHPSSCTERWQIMVYIVLNMSGVAQRLASCNVIKVANDLVDFGIGFSRSQPLFNFVDVGHGMERVAHKIREIFSFMMSVPQCQYVVFGPCHVAGYLPFLEPYLMNPDLKHRVKLFETSGATDGFDQQPRMKIDDVFRAEPLPPESTTARSLLTAAVPSTTVAVPKQGTDVGPSSPAASTVPATATSNGAKSTVSAPPRPSPASRSLLSARPSPSATTKTARKCIYLNSAFQRLDESLPSVQAHHVKLFNERSKDYQFCINYHLLGKCPSEKTCAYVHGEPLNEVEKVLVKRRLRTRKCKTGSSCDDFDCFYTHRCKFGKDCNYGKECRFGDTHNVDPKPAFRKYPNATKLEIIRSN